MSFARNLGAGACESAPALETAVSAERTELLEIGANAYRRLLAKGVKKRIGGAVAVLRATGALVRVGGVETGG